MASQAVDRTHPLAGIRGEITIHKALELKGLPPSGDVEVKGRSVREAPGDD